MFVIVLSSAVSINGFVTRVIGPFDNLSLASQWAGANDEKLLMKGVKHVTAEYMVKPYVVKP